MTVKTHGEQRKWTWDAPAPRVKELTEDHPAPKSAEREDVETVGLHNEANEQVNRCGNTEQPEPWADHQ